MRHCPITCFDFGGMGAKGEGLTGLTDAGGVGDCGGLRVRQDALLLFLVSRMEGLWLSVDSCSADVINIAVCHVIY